MVSIYAKIKNVSIDSKYFHLRLPIRRLRESTLRSNQEDAIVDLVIGLESLLCSDSPQLETTHRFRLRGAALLPKEYGNSRERIDLMNDLYRLRSAIVHGGVTSADVADTLPKAERFLKSIFTFFLDNVETLGDKISTVSLLDETMVSCVEAWMAETDKHR